MPNADLGFPIEKRKRANRRERRDRRAENRNKKLRDLCGLGGKNRSAIGNRKSKITATCRLRNIRAAYRSVLVRVSWTRHGKYRKVHLPREEWKKGVTPGDSYPVFHTDFGTIAIQICYDCDGNSLIIDPMGRILASSEGKQGVFWAEIDLNLRETLPWVGYWRSIGPRHRMPDTYRMLSMPAGQD